MNKPFFKTCPDKPPDIFSLVVLLDKRDGSAFAGDFFRDLSDYIDVVILNEAWPDKCYDAVFIIQSCGFLVSKVLEDKLSGVAATAQISVIIHTAELPPCSVKGFVPVELMEKTIAIKEPVESLLASILQQKISSVEVADYEAALRYASHASFYTCPINFKQNQLKEAEQIFRNISSISRLDSLCLFYKVAEFSIDDYSLLGDMTNSYLDAQSNETVLIISVDIDRIGSCEECSLGFLAIEMGSR